MKALKTPKELEIGDVLLDLHGRTMISPTVTEELREQGLAVDHWITVQTTHGWKMIQDTIRTKNPKAFGGYVNKFLVIVGIVPALNITRWGKYSGMVYQAMSDYDGSRLTIVELVELPEQSTE